MPSLKPTRPLWKCPRCGRRFAHANQWHSCGRFSVRAHLRGKSPAVRALYRKFVEAAKACGPLVVSPAKTVIAFKARASFAALRIKTRWLEGELLLPRKIAHPCFAKVQSASVRCQVHGFRLRAVSELDDEFCGWLAEAYRAARQEPEDPKAATPEKTGGIGREISEVLRSANPGERET
jgi:hypothetical protein